MTPLASPLNLPMIIIYFRATRKRENHSFLGSLFPQSPYPHSPIPPFPYPPIPPSPETLNNDALIFSTIVIDGVKYSLVQKQEEKHKSSINISYVQ